MALIEQVFQAVPEEVVDIRGGALSGANFRAEIAGN